MYPLDSNHLLPINQSAYQNLLLAVDNGNEVVLLLLDYSTAFNSLDHTVLLQRLANYYSNSGTALQ